MIDLSELRQRLVNLEAERLRPIPPPGPYSADDVEMDPLAGLVLALQTIRRRV